MAPRLELLQLLILTAAPALMSLVAVWSGASGRHWFVRAMVICTCLWLLCPIRAFEPLVIGMIAMPLIAFFTRAIGFPTGTTGLRSRSSSRNGRFRYGLADLLLMLVVAGLFTALVAFVQRSATELHWSHVLGLAFCLILLADTTVAMVLLSGWWKLAISLALLLLVAPTAHVADSFIQQSFHLFPTLGPDSLLLQFTALIPLTVATGGAAIRASTRPGSLDVQWKRFAVRSVGAILVLCLVAPLAVVYGLMLDAPSSLEGEYNGPNSLPAVIQAARRANELNPSSLPLSLFKGKSSRAAHEELQGLYEELFERSAKPGHVETDLVNGNRITPAQFQHTIPVLCRAWEAEIEAATSAGQFSEASRYSVATLRVADMLCHGGLIIDSLLGIGEEGQAIEALRKMRSDVSIARVREILAELREIDTSREPMALTQTRNAVFEDRTWNWAARFERAFRRAYSKRLPYDAAVEGATEHRDTRMRLLMLEFAIRLFEEECGRLPTSLGDLTPDYLSTVPIDPYSGRPLIYRRTGNRYKVYSTGPDRIDNGGRFGNYGQVNGKQGFDFSLAAESQ